MINHETSNAQFYYLQDKLDATPSKILPFLLIWSQAKYKSYYYKKFRPRRFFISLFYFFSLRHWKIKSLCPFVVPSNSCQSGGILCVHFQSKFLVLDIQVFFIFLIQVFCRHYGSWSPKFLDWNIEWTFLLLQEHFK